MKLRNLIYIVKRDIFVSDLCIADDEFFANIFQNIENVVLIMVSF